MHKPSINRFRPTLEALEDRLVPTVNGGSGGLLLVTPPAATAAAQSISIDHQVAADSTLPNGNGFPAHGLKLAAAQSSVLTWIPTT